MISTLHYYNSYKPFILDKEKIRERKTSPYKAYSKQASQYKDTELTYFLNKALNDNVKSYMFELSSNFNGLKNSANSIYEQMYYGLPTDNLEESFQDFTHTYNRFVGFLEENTENSSGFKNILEKTKNIVDSNISTLNDIGINISNAGFLSLKNNMDIKKSNIDLEKAQKFYLDFYDKMCDFMKEPMSNHMNFKDFSYYFNYSGDYNKNSSFKLIEQGILVDISL